MDDILKEAIKTTFVVFFWIIFVSIGLGIIIMTGLFIESQVLTWWKIATPVVSVCLYTFSCVYLYYIHDECYGGLLQYWKERKKRQLIIKDQKARAKKEHGQITIKE
jgi:hypothetical protein